MAKFNLTLPKMGESVDEATIVSWLKNVGDQVSTDDFVVEIATDKVDSEVPTEVEGVIVEHCFKVNDVVKVGDTLCVIETTSDVEKNINEEIKVDESEIAEIPNIEMLPENVNKNSKIEQIDDVFLSPLVRNIIKQENISSSELNQIKGTGKSGRITKKDLLSYIKNSNNKNVNYIEDVVNVAKNESQVRDLSRMEKILSKHMLDSKNSAVHVQTFIEADITDLANWRDNQKIKFLDSYGEKLTYTHPLTQIVSKVLRNFPILNASLVDDKVIYKKDVNIGLATALQDGSLIVPVIKNADQLSLAGISKLSNSLVNKARKNNLNPDDVQDGTFTISNIGTFDNIMGTPIINQPQLAILAFGAIRKLPRVVETDKGDFIAIRKIILLSLSFDHRIINGATGGLFLKEIKSLIENWKSDSSI
ncbi:MAG: dihydrolipoamide acetyltransferase family protein [Flavobacteriaceae bacterium]|jgi:2-oxoglutarate dehydrogenase E2 component (dihydrolipoamide succinyltransferase)|tara:strand:+ start:411 stop:1670 length:1260 start_codon:yes stop_codon:yes gene_type:complete